MSQVDDAELSAAFHSRQIAKKEEAIENASFANFLLGKVQTTFTVSIPGAFDLELREPNNTDKIRLMKIGAIGSRLYQESKRANPEENLDELERMISLAAHTLDEIDLFLESMTVDNRLTGDNFYAKLPASTKEVILSEVRKRAGVQAKSALKTRKK